MKVAVSGILSALPRVSGRCPSEKGVTNTRCSFKAYVAQHKTAQIITGLDTGQAGRTTCSSSFNQALAHPIEISIRCVDKFSTTSFRSSSQHDSKDKDETFGFPHAHVFSSLEVNL